MYRRVTSESDGTFAIDNVPEGAFDLFVAGMFGNEVGERTRVEVTWGALREDVVVRCAAVGAIHGIVVDEKGKPMSGLSLQLSYDYGSSSGTTHGSTGVDGRFKWSTLPKGTYQVAVTGGGEPVSAEPEGDELRIVHRKKETVVIAGTVYAPDGSPLASGTLMIYTHTSGGGMSGHGATVASGAFRHEQPKTKDKITLRIEGGRNAQGLSVNAQPCMIESYVPDGEPVEMRMEAGLVLAGVVVDDDGRPATDVSLRTRKSQSGHQFWSHMGNNLIQPDREGRFRKTGLASGDYLLTVHVRGTPFIQPEPMTVSAGKTDVRIVLTRGRELRGVLRGDEGKGVGGANLTYSWPAPAGAKRGGSVHTQSQPDGSFVIGGLPAGIEGTLNVNPSATRSEPYVMKTIKGVAAGATDLVVELETGVYIEGTVTGPEGRP